MRKGEIAAGSLSALSFLAAFDAYAGTGTSSWLADLCLSGDASAPMIEGMPPMENHTKHAAYFTSGGLTFLAAALGWESAEAQFAKLTPRAPEGIERKRLLATVVYVATAAGHGNKPVIDQTFKTATGYALGPTEAKEAYDYLLGANAPQLERVLAGATERERQGLLHAVVSTWASHGMDSEQSTQITEQIVKMLGFVEDDMCKTLDRIWLKSQTNKGVHASWRFLKAASIAMYRAAARATAATIRAAAPHAKRLTRRALTAIQR